MHIFLTTIVPLSKPCIFHVSLHVFIHICEETLFIITGAQHTYFVLHVFSQNGVLNISTCNIHGFPCLRSPFQSNS